MRRLAPLRRDLGPAQFTGLLSQVASSAGQAQAILSRLNQIGEAGSA